MRKWLLLGLVHATALCLFAARPELQSEPREGVSRAVVLHAHNQELVTDAHPARPGQSLILLGRGVGRDVRVLVGTQQVAASLQGTHRLPLRSRLFRRSLPGVQGAIQSLTNSGAWDQVAFTVPADAAGSFVELSLLSGGERSNSATIPVKGPPPDPSQLSAEDVEGLILRAALAIDGPRMAVAVTDRAGRPLGVYRRPQTTNDDVETALSLARTGAFFSHDQAPLSSRTIRTLSRENFPNAVPNQPAGGELGWNRTGQRGHDDSRRVADFQEST